MPPKIQIMCEYKGFQLIFEIYSTYDKALKNAEEKLKTIVKNPEDWNISY